MEKKDIEQLATLARIELGEKEANELSEDVTSILSYVTAVQEITAERSGKKSVRPLHNVMREDGDPHAEDAYTEGLLDAAPERTGRHIQVKKILTDT